MPVLSQINIGARWEELLSLFSNINVINRLNEIDESKINFIPEMVTINDIEEILNTIEATNTSVSIFYVPLESYLRLEDKNPTKIESSINNWFGGVESLINLKEKFPEKIKLINFDSFLDDKNYQRRLGLISAKDYKFKEYSTVTDKVSSIIIYRYVKSLNLEKNIIAKLQACSEVISRSFKESEEIFKTKLEFDQFMDNVKEERLLQKTENEKLLKNIFDCQEQLEILLSERKKSRKNINKKRSNRSKREPEYTANDSIKAYQQLQSTAIGEKLNQSFLTALAHKLTRIAIKIKLYDPLRQEKRLLRNSEYFDEQWYMQSYSDLKHVDGVSHYLKHGSSEGRNPSKHFNTNSYLLANKDVALSGVNPLVHFIKYGIQEKRKTK